MKSTQQSNQTDGGWVIPTLLNFDGTKHLKVEKQVNLLLFPLSDIRT